MEHIQELLEKIMLEKTYYLLELNLEYIFHLMVERNGKNLT